MESKHNIPEDQEDKDDNNKLETMFGLYQELHWPYTTLGLALHFRIIQIFSIGNVIAHFGFQNWTIITLISTFKKYLLKRNANFCKKGSGSRKVISLVLFGIINTKITGGWYYYNPPWLFSIPHRFSKNIWYNQKKLYQAWCNVKGMVFLHEKMEGI